MEKTYDFEDNIQKSIIYLCKSSEDFLIQCLPLVKEEYFEATTYQKIFKIIKSHYYEYKEIPNDSQIVEEAKGILSKTERLGEYRSEIDSINSISTLAFSNSEYYLNKVEDFAKKQAFSSAILESLPKIESGDFEFAFERIRESLKVSRKVYLGVDYFDTVKSRYSEENSRKCEYQTVFKTFNEHLGGGIAAGELSIVVAPPGVGKSIYLANQAVTLSKLGYNVLYISLEMDESRVSSRMDSIFTRIPSVELKYKVDEISKRMSMVGERYQPLGRIKVRQFPTKQCSIAQLRAYITQLENYDNFVPQVLIVDYLDIMSSDCISKYDAQQELAENLRGLAIEHNLAVCTATQTTREAKKVKIITDSELADCYGKVRVADFVISLNQTEEERDKGIMRAFSIKNRNGPAHKIVNVRIQYSTLIMMEA